ncbi:MAG: tetratricopeptide repeat protein [Bacteroidia bacterium]
MKLKYSIYLIVLIVFQAIGQQNKFDSIENILKSKIHDTVKCNVLASFIESGLDENVWPIYNEKLLHLSLNAAKNTNKADYKRFYFSYYTIALSNKGFLASNKGDFKTSDSLYKQTIFIQKKFNLTEAIGISYTNLGANSKAQSNVKKSLMYYDSALKIFLKYNNKNQTAIIYNNLAYIFKNEKEYKTAIKHYKNSMKIHQEMKDYSGLAIVMGNLANVNLENINEKEITSNKNKKIILESLILLERGEKITDSLHDENDHAIFLNKLGNFYDYYGDIRISDKKQKV